MERLIDKLPGVAMSVESVTDTLRHMWDADAGGGQGPMDFRASQLNLILHFGLSTTVGEGQEHFNTAIRFAQKYPCRIVVLCPLESVGAESEFEGKLFSQCYIGKHLRDPKRMTPEGRADTKPVAPNDTPANRALNRRVEIFLFEQEKI